MEHNFFTLTFLIFVTGFAVFEWFAVFATFISKKKGWVSYVAELFLSATITAAALYLNSGWFGFSL